MYAGHGRLHVPEALDSVKSEYENLSREFGHTRALKEELEHKLQAQLSELATLQQMLGELERNHNKLRLQYEDEIARLRRQVESGSSATGGLNVLAAAGAGATSQQSSGHVFQAPLPTEQNTHYQHHQGQGLPQLPLLNIPSAGPMQPGSAAPQGAGTLEPLVAATKLASKRYALGSNGELVHSLKELASAPAPAAAVPEETKQVESLPPQRQHASGDAGAADWGVSPIGQSSLKLDRGPLLQHGSVVCCVKFSADGKSLATGCNRTAQLYDVETGNKTLVFGVHEGGAAVVTPGDVPLPPLPKEDLYIRSVCFSPDSQILATGGEDRCIRLWSVPQRKIVQSWPGHDLDVYALEFNSDGRLIVSGSGDKKAKVWDVERGHLLLTLGSDEIGPKDGVPSVAISPDGKYVAAGSLDRVVRIWDAHSGYFLERFEGHKDSVYSVAFSPDGRTLASGSLDKTIKLWDLQMGARQRSRCRATLTGHSDYVLSVAFSPDGNWLVSGSKDRTALFWDTQTGSPHLSLSGHRNSVISVAVSPRGGSLATGSGDNRARLWRYSGSITGLGAQQPMECTPSSLAPLEPSSVSGQAAPTKAAE